METLGLQIYIPVFVKLEVCDRVRILDSGLHHEEDGIVVTISFGSV